MSINVPAIIQLDTKQIGIIACLPMESLPRSQCHCKSSEPLTQIETRCLHCMDLPYSSSAWLNLCGGQVPGVRPPYTESAIHRVLNHYLQIKLKRATFNRVLQLYPAAMFTTPTARLSAMLVDSRGWIGHCQTQYAAELVGKHHPSVWVYHFVYKANLSVTNGVVGHFSEVPLHHLRTGAFDVDVGRWLSCSTIATLVGSTVAVAV